MTTEDLQDRYRDKGQVKLDAVPLAADAAHLLADYLDSLTVELVRAGVTEPYRIARDFEEIFAQELKKVGITSKLTYEVVEQVLDDYGSPVEVVRQYIAENQPEREHYISSKVPEDEMMEDLSFGPRSAEYESGSWGPVILVYAAFVATLFSQWYEILVPWRADEWFPLTSLLLAVMLGLDIITGLVDQTVIPPRHYRHLMRSVKLSLVAQFLVFMAGGAEQRSLVVFLFLMGLIVIGLIKLRTPLLDDYTRVFGTKEERTVVSAIKQGLVYLVLLGASGVMLLIMGQLIIAAELEWELELAFGWMTAGLVMLLVVELMTALVNDSVIAPHHYHTLRETARFLLSSLLLVAVLKTADDPEFVEILVWTLAYWLVIFGVGWLRDHTALLADPTAQARRHKPLARFLLPSYILLAVTYVGMGLLLLSNGNNVWVRDDPWYQFWLVMMLLVGAASLLAEYNRRYPLSYKKIGLTLLLAIVPLLLYTYPRDARWFSTRLWYSNQPLAVGLIIGWVITWLILTLLLFRWEIRSQLRDYRQQVTSQLSDYQLQIRDQLDNYRDH